MLDISPQRSSLNPLFVMLAIFIFYGCNWFDSKDSGNITAPNDKTTGAVEDSLILLRPGIAASVRLIDNGFLLTNDGDSLAFELEAFDSSGTQILVEEDNILWSSSSPDIVTIGAKSGIASGLAVGSSYIIYSYGGFVDSVQVMVATFKPEIVRVGSEKVIKGPAVLPGQDNSSPWVGTRFEVKLDSSVGIEALTNGRILVQNTTDPFAGKVVSVEGQSNIKRVTLEVVPITEIISELRINQDISLENAELNVSEEVQKHFNVRRGAQGEYILDAKTKEFPILTGALPKRMAGGPVGTRAVPGMNPFDCEVSPGLKFKDKNGNLTLASLPIRLEFGNTAISIKQKLSVPHSFTERGLEKLALKGRIDAEVKFTTKIAAPFDQKFGCSVEIGSFNVPLPGLLSFLVGIQVPFGVGFEVGGKLTLADISLEAKGKGFAEFEMGYYNPPKCDLVPNATGCGFDAKGEKDWQNELTMPKIPSSFSEVVDGIRFEPKASVFGYARIAVGNPMIRALRVEFFEYRAGASVVGNFASVRAQMRNTKYDSKYVLTLDNVAKLGPDIEKALSLLGIISWARFEIKSSDTLSRSPTAKVLSVDKKNYVPDDILTFNVTLDEKNIEFIPGFYNVSEVFVYRKEDTVKKIPHKLITSQVATPGQTKFTLQATAKDSGITDSAFYAFVKTKAWPPPILSEFELGVLNTKKLAGPGKIKIENWQPAGGISALSDNGTISETQDSSGVHHYKYFAKDDVNTNHVNKGYAELDGEYRFELFNDSLNEESVLAIELKGRAKAVSQGKPEKFPGIPWSEYSQIRTRQSSTSNISLQVDEKVQCRVEPVLGFIKNIKFAKTYADIDWTPIINNVGAMIDWHPNGKDEPYTLYPRQEFDLDKGKHKLKIWMESQTVANWASTESRNYHVLLEIRCNSLFMN